MNDKNTYRIGFYVEVEVEAIDGVDAIHIANAACGWPGYFQPPLKPIKHTQSTRRGIVSASVTRSEGLMIKQMRKDDDS